jgi:ubiquinone/menaquinone biosynthesis C-methylase UbiE
MVIQSIGKTDTTNRRTQHSTGKLLLIKRLEDYETLKPIIETFNLPPNANVINLGCGNSELCEAMYDAGFKNLCNIDICENVIEFMKQRNAERKEMTCKFILILVHKMDVRDLKFNDNTFDLAVDKSTIDALLCGDSSFLNVAIMTKEVQRVLKTGGIYMIISYGQPENRVFHLEREHLSFDINIYTIKKETCDIDIGDKEKVICL